MIALQPILAASRPLFGMLILIILAIVILRWLADGKVGKALLVAGGLVFLVFVTYQTRSVPHSARPTAVAVATAHSHPGAHDPSIDALWDQLTAGRIDLEQLKHSQIELASAKSIDSDSPEVTADADLSLLHHDEQDEQADRPRPDWVTSEPKIVGTVYRQVVSSGPWDTIEAARHELETNQLPAAIRSRIEAVVAPKVGHEVHVPDLLPLGIGLDFIFREVCREEFTESVDSSVGPMKNTYVLLEFDDGVDDQLREAWFRYQRGQHLGVFAKIAAGILLCLSAAYGLMRFDTWTRGYYSRQLLWGTVAAIIAVSFFALT